MELFEASNQWAARPVDQRFWDLDELQAVVEAHRAGSGEKTVPWKALRIEADQQDLRLVGRAGVPAHLTHFAFGQLSTLVGAPAGYLRALPATLAAQNVNHGLAHRVSRANDAQLLFHKNGTLTARAITTEVYDRIWNADLVPRFRDLLGAGWRVPPARPSGQAGERTRTATEADIIPGQDHLGLSVRIGDPIAPAGLYASDHDLFVFMIDPERTIDNGPRALMRGVFCRNSEVGDGSLVFTFFLLDAVCGNHIVWGAQNVHEVRIRHVGEGSLAKGLRKFSLQLRAYEDSSAGSIEARLTKARTIELGATKDEVIDAVFAYAQRKRLRTLGRKRLEAAYITAEKQVDRYGSPRTAWGLVSGLTENSQQGFADERDAVDRDAGKVLDIVF